MTRTRTRTLQCKGTADLHKVEKMVDKVIEELALITPNTHGKKIDSIKHKLDYILKILKVSKTVQELEKMVRDVKKLTVSDSKVEGSFVEKEDLFKVLVACKSVAEIESKLACVIFKLSFYILIVIHYKTKYRVKYTIHKYNMQG